MLPLLSSHMDSGVGGKRTNKMLLKGITIINNYILISMYVFLYKFQEL